MAMKHVYPINHVDQLKNVAEYIAETLESQILDGSLSPSTRLVQTEIADSFGVSRLPVRDALRILEKKELVITLPRKGMVVRPVTEKEAKELFELRLLLEGYAFTASAPLLGRNNLDRLDHLVEEQMTSDPSNFGLLMDIDEQFHMVLISECDNEEIRKQIVNLWRRIRMLRALARNVDEWNRRSAKGHKRIIEALRSSDFDLAKQHLTAGMLRAQDEICHKLKE
jgi:DNA-binding GntR family transcriptional regulator